MRIYLHGSENIGWSIDSDRMHTERFLKELGHTITNNLIKAEVVHSVWWNQLLTRRHFFLRFKRKIIATATNKIDPDNRDYLKAKKWVTLWIAPSKRQFDTLKTDGVNVAYQPFYVDEKVFRKLDKSRIEIATLLGIDFGLIKDKFLIGSFQRDTLGTDMKSPRWQKGPELLVEILSSLPDKDRWVLVLAGPRRHFIINECEKNGIPYYYYGLKPTTGVDDIGVNTLDHEKMSLLYNLIDSYLVTSKSEGGPKAIHEACFCKTLIFSTDVGLSPDILDGRCIYNNVGAITSYLLLLINGDNKDHFNNLIINNFNNANSLCSYKIMKERWKQIYDQIQSIR